MAGNAPRIGWIGAGRMGLPMAELMVKAGNNVTVWNRTAAKAEPLAKLGAKVVKSAADLSGLDIVFSIVSTGKDLEEVYFGPGGVTSGKGKLPAVFVDCSTIGVEESALVRKRLNAAGAQYVAAPVSGNASVIRARKLSSVASGPKAAFAQVETLIKAYAPGGVSYVGEGELARVCKIAHNVMLGVVIENLIEITLLCNKMGVPRHAARLSSRGLSPGSNVQRMPAGRVIARPLCQERVDGWIPGIKPGMTAEPDYSAVRTRTRGSIFGQSPARARRRS